MFSVRENRNERRGEESRADEAMRGDEEKRRRIFKRARYSLFICFLFFLKSSNTHHNPSHQQNHKQPTLLSPSSRASSSFVGGIDIGQINGDGRRRRVEAGDGIIFGGSRASSMTTPRDGASKDLDPRMPPMQVTLSMHVSCGRCRNKTTALAFM